MKRIIYFLAAALFLWGAICFMPEIKAEDKKAKDTFCTALCENSSGTLISGNNENVHVPQGYLPKLMTVLLTAEAIEEGKFSSDDTITVGSEAENAAGAVVWLTAGEKITVDELLKSVIIGNAGDAALTLAVNVAGDEESFVDMMNARAFELGMRNTVYRSCGGKDDPSEYTTASDMGKLAGELLKHTELRKYFTAWIDRVRGGQTEVVNENRLVRDYEGVTGLKACHSELSGCALILSAERDGNSFTAVILGCDDEDERFKTGKQMLAAAFSSYKVTTPDFSNEFIRPVTVHGGVEKSVMVGAGDISELVVPKSGGELSAAVMIPEYVDAPVKKGQKVGCIGFYNGKTLLYETDLVALAEVEKRGFWSSIAKCLIVLYK